MMFCGFLTILLELLLTTRNMKKMGRSWFWVRNGFDHTNTHTPRVAKFVHTVFNHQTTFVGVLEVGGGWGEKGRVSETAKIRTRKKTWPTLEHPMHLPCKGVEFHSFMFHLLCSILWPLGTHDPKRNGGGGCVCGLVQTSQGNIISLTKPLSTQGYQMLSHTAKSNTRGYRVGANEKLNLHHAIISHDGE